MKFEGILHIKVNERRKTETHTVEYTNQNGKAVNFVVPPQARFYRGASDGDVCTIEVENNQVVKCEVAGKPGQPAAAPMTAEASSATRSAGRQGGGQGGSYYKSGGFQGHGGGGANRYSGYGRSSYEPVEGTAPYNFVPYKDGALARPVQGEARQWSGEIVCELEALTPLLVSGRQKKGEGTECRFMRVGGKNIIPGTAVKGMLRSLIEILSFSGLKPVSKKKLFWREVAEDYYRVYFPENVKGGFLRKKGADYTLRPAQVTPRDADAPEDDPKFEKVNTGGFFKDGKKSKSYFFDLTGNEKEIELDRDVVLRLEAQLTENQRKRWADDKRARRMASSPGLPVFYRLNHLGEVVELGFCRYFRLEYNYSPFDLAWPDRDKEEEADIASVIFGHAGKKSVAGRVAIEPFAIEGKPHDPDGLWVVLGSPKPTCLPFYLVQEPDRIKVISHGRKNERTSMNNYNEKSSRLRGRKLYWHHDPDPACFPPGNENRKTQSCLHPLAAGARGRFVIHVNRLTDSELGCLLEALELRKGCAHKLGMGRSLGFGSVRVSIVAANLADSRQKYLSLADRLQGGEAKPMQEEKRRELRRVFRDHVFGEISSHWPQAKDYYALPPIADLYLLLNYEKRPSPKAVATMDLQEFRNNPLLPDPKQVLNG